MDPVRIQQALGGEVDTRAIDLRDSTTYDRANEGMGGLFLLRPPPIGNVKETLNVLIDRAIEAGVKHITLLSVDGADRQRWGPHHKVEQHILSSDVSYTLMRPGFFVQNLGEADKKKGFLAHNLKKETAWEERTSSLPSASGK